MIIAAFALAGSATILLARNSPFMIDRHNPSFSPDELKTSYKTSRALVLFLTVRFSPDD
jgi:hypothetical protein